MALYPPKQPTPFYFHMITIRQLSKEVMSIVVNTSLIRIHFYYAEH